MVGHLPPCELYSGLALVIRHVCGVRDDQAFVTVELFPVHVSDADASDVAG